MGGLWKVLLCCMTGLWLSSADSTTSSTQVKLNVEQMWLRASRKYCKPNNNNSTGAGGQVCAAGQYRERYGPHKGQCKPCNCNGLSRLCDPNTGVCLNCSMNTAGPHCERCAEGYYGNAVLRTCRLCPCPLASQSFALGCWLVGDQVECLCRPGYAGTRCERCAVGFHGNPLEEGRDCRPCECADDLCDPITGACRNPDMPDTDGDCQECDSCVETLADDLEEMDPEFSLLKTQLQHYSRTSASLTALTHLEQAVNAANVTVMKYNTSVHLLSLRVTQLETDVEGVTHDLNSLRVKADQTSLGVNELLQDLVKTQEKGKDLLTDAEELLQKIEELLQEVEAQHGDVVMRMLEEAEGMLKKMQRQNCELQRKLAEDELEEAQRLSDKLMRNLSISVSGTHTLVVGWKLLNSGLTQLEEAVKNADRRVMKTELINEKNEDTLSGILKRHQTLQMEKDGAEAGLLQTDLVMRDTAHLLQTITDLKNDFAALAAELDGAKASLTLRLEEISKAALMDDVVRRAEDYAQHLMDLAMQFQISLLKFTNTSVIHKAVETIKAYRDVVDALLKAEAAAREAHDAAQQALQDAKTLNLTERAEQLTKSADVLHNQGLNAENSLKEVDQKYEGIKERLARARAKAESLHRDSRTVDEELGQIKRDDIGAMLNLSKAAVETATNTIHTASGRLEEISAGLDMIHTSSGDSKVDDVLNSVNKTLREVNALFPALTDALSEVEQQAGLLHGRNNVSDSISRIRAMIAVTRDMANKIRGPILFSGVSHVELQPPTSPEELRTFTALNLTLHRPKLGTPERAGARRRRQGGAEGDNMIVLYLGNKKAVRDYVALVVRDGLLYCLYKLGDFLHEIKTSEITRSNSNSSFMDRVDFRRIYQDAEVIYTRTFTSAEPMMLEPMRSYSNSTASLLELEPEDLVLYVGGFPHDFTPPKELQYPNFRGCIEFSTLNENILGLYNFRRAVNVKNTDRCLRGEATQEAKYFDGSGYGRFNIPKRSRIIKFTVRSRQENAMLLFMGTEDSYLTLTVENGFVVLHSWQSDREITERSRAQVFPTADYQTVQIVQSTSQTQVNISALSVIIWVDYRSYSEAVIGGVPAAEPHRHSIRAPAFRGCLKSLEVGVYVQFTEEVGIVPGCPVALLGLREASLQSGSSLSLSPAADAGRSGAGTMVSLGFRSNWNSGVLLHAADVAAEVELSLADGHVEMRSHDSILKSRKRYDEGQWHYVTAFRNSTRMELNIDNSDPGEEQTQLSKTTTTNTPHNLILGNGTFRGCIRDFYMRSVEEAFVPADLSSFTHTGAVTLGSCVTQRPLKKRGHVKLQDLDKSDLQGGVRLIGLQFQTFTTTSAYQINVAQQQDCSRPASLVQAFSLSSSSSQVQFSITTQELNDRPHFSLDVRTRSADGLLLQVAGGWVGGGVVLFVTRGRVKLAVGDGGLISYHEKINDDEWHNVRFSVEQHSFHMVVDGFRVPDGQLKKDEGISLNLHGPVYIGAAQVPLVTKRQNKVLPQVSMVGCVRDVRFNADLIGDPTVNHGAAPCFEGKSVSGAYFAGDGSYVVLGNSFRLGAKFDLRFEIRPRGETGLLLHCRDQHQHTLSVFLMKGEVVAQLGDAAGRYNVSVVTSRQLCDGRFHHVAVSRNARALTLRVDQDSTYTVLPSTHRHSQTHNTLYVGGVPVGENELLSVWSSYVGCMRKVKINRAAVSFASVTGVFGPVNVHECPAH